MKDLLTTRNQNCWRELIEKETYSRVAWRVHYDKGHLKAPGPVKKHPISTQKGLLSTIINSPKLEDTETQRFGRRAVGVWPPQEAEKKGQGECVKSKPLLAEMRPASPRLLRLLYQGVSHEGRGRLQYLRERQQQKPEEGFKYPVLSSWDYGWCLGDAIKEAKAPGHARSRVIKDTFYFRNGIFYPPCRTDQLL
ncbi:protein ATP6V1FNB [Ornithorhynchus anatinus]|uniref:Sperm microtubule inner protein 1 C-terminal domain-containing protein n=1 Tax=Ornithorhynchus anatinus TaxID=9258 RepID=A0A6I8PJ76_ORNAN|nr:protein ATP6V1FNB [Ornithorhynchus anatinus]